jgi:hypothetical protein
MHCSGRNANCVRSSSGPSLKADFYISDRSWSGLVQGHPLESLKHNLTMLPIQAAATTKHQTVGTPSPSPCCCLCCCCSCTTIIVPVWMWTHSTKEIDTANRGREFLLSLAIDSSLRQCHSRCEQTCMCLMLYNLPSFPSKHQNSLRNATRHSHWPVLKYILEYILYHPVTSISAQPPQLNGR